MSPSRAPKASVTKPCPIRLTNQPHIQLKSDQPFEMEWSTGHGDSGTKFVYFVALHADDYDMLNILEDKMMDDYLNLAPQLLNADTDKKIHLAPKNVEFAWGYYPNTPLPTTSPLYIPRDAIYRANSSFRPIPPDQHNQFQFFPNMTLEDKRASYVSTKYPWMLAVHKFKIVFAENHLFASQADVARFTLPARRGPGDYIYHYKWGGYRDCIDIDVQPTTVSNRYGTLDSTKVPQYVKLDHCEFYFVTQAVTQCRIMSKTVRSAQQCIDDCNGKGGQCTAVQVARVTNPSGLLPYTPNIPFGGYIESTQSRPENFDKCEHYSIHKRKVSGCTLMNTGLCNLATLKPADDDYICYGLRPAKDEQFQTIDDFETVNDPQDPKFYSTCFIKVSDGGFINIPQIEKTSTPAWNVGDKCISCSFRDQVKAMPFANTPDWTTSLTENCVHCDAKQL